MAAKDQAGLKSMLSPHRFRAPAQEAPTDVAVPRTRITSFKSSRFEHRYDHSQRIRALQDFGYDQDEARFLCIAALQSGYFVRRQFLWFVGRTKAWKGVPFLNKLQTKRHCQVTHYRHNRTVYHLSAKPLYRALGDRTTEIAANASPQPLKTSSWVWITSWTTLHFSIWRPSERNSITLQAHSKSRLGICQRAGMNRLAGKRKPQSILWTSILCFSRFRSAGPPLWFISAT